ncbi:MAG: DUF6804 family protein [Chloroflexota bacterium]
MPTERAETTMSPPFLLMAAQGIAAAMLLWALFPGNPYGYYNLLRVVVCIAAAWSIVDEFKRGAGPIMWIFVFFAVLYNPLVPIHLTRDIWVLLNLLTAATLGGRCASEYLSSQGSFRSDK